MVVSPPRPSNCFNSSPQRRIAENLHRCDLSKDQRDQHIRRYAELIEARGAIVCQNDKQLPKAVGRPKSVVTQVAEATGLSTQVVRRAIDPKPRPQLVEVKDALDVVTEQADAIVRAWNRACPNARQLAMEQIDAGNCG